MTHIPTHHPSDEILLRHAAGTLSAGTSLVVAAHLGVCVHCRAMVRLGEAVGGVLLADTPAEAMAADALNRALARVDEPASISRRAFPAAELAQGVPMPAVLRGIANRSWRWVAPGIGRIRLDVPGAAPGERAYLLRVVPGSVLPEHGHNGLEVTCVLAGRFRDSSGSFGPGDVAEMAAGDDHQPVAEPGEICICLIATQGRLRMRSVLARVLQPLVGV